MTQKIVAAIVQWIRPECGGRLFPPVIGLRPIIRFQRYVEQWLESAWDIEIIDIDFDSITLISTVKFRLSPNAPEQLDGLLRENELIEILDAYRVIAVGKIISIASK